MQPILLQRIGVDQFINRITRLRENPAFRDASPELHVIEQSTNSREQASDLDTLTFADALPDLVFDYAFVDLLKTSYLFIQRSITKDPSETTSESTVRKDPELLAEVKRLRERIREQAAELELLETKFKGAEADKDREHTTLLKEITDLSEQVQILTQELESARSELTLAKSMASKVKTSQSEAASLAEEKKALQMRLQHLEQELIDERTRADEALRDKEDFAILLEDTIAKRTQDKAKLKEAGIVVSDDDDAGEDIEPSDEVV